MSTKATHVVHVFPLPELQGPGFAVADDDELDRFPDAALELYTPPGFRLNSWQAEGARLVVCWERLPEPSDPVEKEKLVTG
jgi:hypothetical protein